jgi:hypothetical protein
VLLASSGSVRAEEATQLTDTEELHNILTNITSAQEKIVNMSTEAMNNVVGLCTKKSDTLLSEELIKLSPEDQRKFYDFSLFKEICAGHALELEAPLERITTTKYLYDIWSTIKSPSAATLKELVKYFDMAGSVTAIEIDKLESDNEFLSKQENSYFRALSEELNNVIAELKKLASYYNSRKNAYENLINLGIN